MVRKKEKNRVIDLNIAIQEGIDSGRMKSFDAKKFLQDLKARKTSNG